MNQPLFLAPSLLPATFHPLLCCPVPLNLDQSTSFVLHYTLKEEIKSIKFLTSSYTVNGRGVRSQHAPTRPYSHSAL